MATGFSMWAEPKGFKSRSLGRAEHWFDRLDENLAKVGVKVLNEVRKNMSGRILHRRSGNLWRSWGVRMDVSGDTHNVIIGSDWPYARIHDMGGFTGRGHKTRIPKRAYARKALTARKNEIRRAIKDFMARAALG